MTWFLILAFMATPAAAASISAAELVDLPDADVVILGEVHDNPAHHQHQAAVIRALRPTAVIWEMLTADQAARMPEDRRDPVAVAQALAWDGTGWPDFALYQPIVEAAGRAAHYGAGVPRVQARRAFAEGAAAVFGRDALVFGLHTDLAASEQAQREALQFDAHCQAMPLDMMSGMVEAQRLRDASLAHATILALRDSGGPVVVITGNGHARTDWGVPAILRQADPDVRVVSVGQLEGSAGDAEPWDFWIITEPHPRGDPCAAFQ